MRYSLSAEKIEKIMRYFFIFITSVAIAYNIYALRTQPEDFEWERLSGAIITLILFILPSIVSRRTKVTIPIPFQIMLLLFIFASMYLGEVRRFFYRYPNWDSMLHTWSAMMLAYMGFLLIFALNKDKDMHLNLSPFFIALFTFCFAVTVGTMWEIFEFLVDELLGVNMQKARNLTDAAGVVHSRLGVMDTMRDLVVDAIGAFIVSFICFIYCKKKMVKDNTFWRLKDQFIEENPDLFK